MCVSCNPDEKKWHKKETIFLNIKSVNEEPKTIIKLTERTGGRGKQNEGEKRVGERVRASSNLSVLFEL